MESHIGFSLKISRLLTRDSIQIQKQLRSNIESGCYYILTEGKYSKIRLIRARSQYAEFMVEFIEDCHVCEGDLESFLNEKSSDEKIAGLITNSKHILTSLDEIGEFNPQLNEEGIAYNYSMNKKNYILLSIN